MLGRPEWITILWTGVLQGAVTLGIFAWTLRAEGIEQARNMAFTTIVFGELFRAFAARSRTKTFWSVGALSNVRLLGVVVVSGALQIGMHHVGFAERLFDLAPVSMSDCLLSIGLGLIPVSAIEIAKLVGKIPAVAGGRTRRRTSAAPKPEQAEPKPIEGSKAPSVRAPDEPKDGATKPLKP